MMARSKSVTMGSSPRPPGGKPRRKVRRRLGRFLLVSFVLFVVLIVGLVALAPTIAGQVAPGLIEDALNPKLKGSIDVTDVRIRWMRAGSPTQTATAVVYDDRHNKVAEVTLESQVGIFNVVGGLGNLGEFVVTGSADIVRFADGTTNLERVFAPLMQGGQSSTPAPKPGGGGPVEVPPNLRAVLRIASLTGTYTDQSLPVPLRVVLEKMSGRAVFATGLPAELTLDVAMVTGSGATTQRGTLSIDGTVDHITTAAGALTIDQAAADITIAARDLPIGIADSLAGLGGTLTRAIGDRLGFDISVVGSAQQGTARLSVATDGGTSIAGSLGFAGGLVTTTQPLVFTLDTARAAAADPNIAAALSGSEAARITTLPTLSVSLADLSVRVPTGGAPLDLRGTSATLTAALGEMAGTVLVPGQSTPRTFRLTPMDVVLKTQDLATGIGLSTAGQARIDNQPAGHLSVAVNASGLLDASGAPSSAMPVVAGSVLVEDFALTIFQPILDAIAPASGITLATAIGPTLDLQLGAESESGGGVPLAPGQIPPTSVTLAVDSANVTAGGNVRIASDALRTLDDQGVWLKVASLAPLLGAMLEPAGLTLASGGELTLRAQDISIIEPMAATPPLDRARARLSVAFSETRGQLRMGATPTNYRLDPGQVSFTVDGASDAIALAGRIDAFVTGNGRITTQLDTTLSGLLGQLTGKAQAATSSGEGIRVTATELGRWLAAVLPAGAPVRIDPSGQMSIALTGIAIAAPPARPAGAAKAPAAPDIVQRLTMNLDVTGSGVRFAPVLAAAFPGEAAPVPEMIEMSALTLAARLAPATAPSLTLDSSYTTGGQTFKIGGNLALARPLAQATTMRQMVPRGRMALEQVPIELLRLLPISIPGPDGQPMNLTALAGEAVGRKLDVVLGLTPPARGAPADDTGVALRVTGRGLRLDAGGTINAAGFAANESVLTATLTPRLVQMLGNNFAPTMEQRPTLTESASLRATLAAFAVPLDENLSPRAGALVPLRATIETAMTLDHLVLAKDNRAQPINAGPVRLEGVRATAAMSLALGAPVPGSAAPAAGGAAPSAAAAPMSVDFAAIARRPGRADSSLLNLTGTATMTGPSLNASATLADVDLAWVEGAINQPGMLSGALGPTLRAEATFAGDPATTARASLTLAAANLSMAQPVRVALSPQSISLASPLTATFTATPEWATRYMFGQTDPSAQAVKVQRAIPFALNVASLVVTRGEGRGPLVPSEWGIDATITTPEVAVMLREGQELRYISPEIIVRTARNDPRKVNASVRMTEARQIASNAATPASGTTGVQPAPSQPVPASQPAANQTQNIIRFSIANLMDDAGNVNLPGATAEAIGRIPGFPTTLIDAIAKQDGLLVELLGPAVTVDVTARNVPLAFLAPPAVPAGASAPAASGGAVPTAAPVGQAAAPAAGLRGRVEAELKSDRATARLAGDINNMVLTSSEPLAIDLSEITKAFSEHLVNGMPLVSTFEKPRSLQPATVRGDAITLPMDGNLANLNGRFAIDPGEIQFASSDILGSILKFAGGQSSGVAGRRLQPFTFTIASGVVNYDKFSLPLGEFTISTSGTVDLVGNRMDLLVYIPVGALADDALGMFNLGLGSALSSIAPGYDGALPFRMRGPLGSARPQPAVDVFVKEFGSQLVNPGNLLPNLLPGSGGNGGGLPQLPFFRRPPARPPG